MLRNALKIAPKPLAPQAADVSRSVKSIAYESPFIKAVTTLKFISASTGTTAFLAGNYMGLFGDRALVQSMGAVLLLTGVGSTGALTWFFRPYVTRIKIIGYDQFKQNGFGLDPKKALSSEDLLKLQDVDIELETVGLFGNLKTQRVKIGDLQASTKWRPLVTWQSVCGSKDFFVHSEVMELDPVQKQLHDAIDRSKKHLEKSQRNRK